MAVPIDPAFKIASPVPPQKIGRRIIPDDLPPNTLTKTQWETEAPLRKNVIQINLPTSTTKTIEHVIDPRIQLKPDLKHVLHGVEPVKNANFLQLKLNSKPNENRDHIIEKNNEALEIAKDVDSKAQKTN